MPSGDVLQLRPGGSWTAANVTALESETTDMIGLDVLLSGMQILHHAFADSKYRPCPLLKELGCRPCWSQVGARRVQLLRTFCEVLLWRRR